MKEYEESFIYLRLTSISYEMEKINRIKGALADVGRTGKWLAEQLGKDPATVSKWCTNTSQPDLQTLTRIAEILDINIKDLLVDSKNV